MDQHFEVKEAPAQTILFVRATCKATEIGPTLGRLYGQIGAYLKTEDQKMAGPPLCRYIAMREDAWDLEGGIPVAAPLPGSEEVQCGTLGGCKVVFALHAGPYDRLSQTYDAMRAWMESNGLEAAGAPWDSYITDPGELPDPEDWRTEIFWPVR